MRGFEYRLSATDFQYLDKFLSSVTPTIGSKYTFRQTDFQYCTRGQVLHALGFEYVGVDHKDQPIYCFKNTPSYPPVQIFVPTGVVIPTQWTVVAEIGLSTWLRWNGPTQLITRQTAPRTFLTAKEARELTDNAHQTAKALEKVLEEVYAAAEAGNYSLTMTTCPETVQKRLVDLGFKIIESGISWE